MGVVYGFFVSFMVGVSYEVMKVSCGFVCCVGEG